MVGRVRLRSRGLPSGLVPTLGRHSNKSGTRIYPDFPETAGLLRAGEDLHGKILGGVTGIAKGRTVDLATSFTAGDYALLCFVPDAKDGKPHIAHGMVEDRSR